MKGLSAVSLQEAKVHSFRSSWIWVHPIPAASTMPPKRNLKDFIPEVHRWGSQCPICPGPQGQRSGSVSQKRLVMKIPRWPVTGRMRIIAQPTNWPFSTDRPRLKWHLLPLSWLLNPSRNHQETETSRIIKSTVGITFNEDVNTA